MGMTIGFTSEVALYCKVCGDALEVEESKIGYGRKADFLVSPCKRRLPKVSEVKDLIEKFVALNIER